ncbi:hypothetical protein QJ850_gp696 [Acanthamoeba polyphaga mimivirus]|uniref:Uncharacterized protein n=1 Tax=Acanthamoeba polyphaga mimivirus Kroon TaxID=3069720 RepID=A0A0G2Y2P0_9VIRU|nr:hypothetical protein QJ850_gp696 [Acanthamoeba polyphaga mimivirus]AKI80003.1 hypothetical protein [Acanthamoeba polyphaga mimivirus Kroon]
MNDLEAEPTFEEKFGYVPCGHTCNGAFNMFERLKEPRKPKKAKQTGSLCTKCGTRKKRGLCKLCDRCPKCNFPKITITYQIKSFGMIKDKKQIVCPNACKITDNFYFDNWMA